MAKGPREMIKQHLDASIGHVEKIKEYLVRNGEMNREFHPEITKEYEVVYSFFEEGKNLLEGLLRTY